MPNRQFEAWTFGAALEFVRTLEKHLVPVGFHVALAGSVLHRGESSNDLDIIVFPQCTGHINRLRVYEALRDAGLKLLNGRAAVAVAWERRHSIDTKHVERWFYDDRIINRRVDIFFLY